MNNHECLSAVAVDVRLSSSSRTTTTTHDRNKHVFKYLLYGNHDDKKMFERTTVVLNTLVANIVHFMTKHVYAVDEACLRQLRQAPRAGLSKFPKTTSQYEGVATTWMQCCFSWKFGNMDTSGE
jgi:hypothetical protein